MTKEEKIDYIDSCRKKHNHSESIEGIVSRTLTMYGKVTLSSLSGFEVEDLYSLIYIFDNPLKS